MLNNVAVQVWSRWQPARSACTGNPFSTASVSWLTGAASSAELLSVARDLQPSVTHLPPTVLLCLVVLHVCSRWLPSCSVCVSDSSSAACVLRSAGAASSAAQLARSLWLLHVLVVWCCCSLAERYWHTGRGACGPLASPAGLADRQALLSTYRRLALRHVRAVPHVHSLHTWPVQLLTTATWCCSAAMDADELWPRLVCT